MKRLTILLLLLCTGGLQDDAETARHDAVLYHSMAVSSSSALETAWTDVKAKQEYLHNEYGKWSSAKQDAYDSAFANFYPFILDAFNGIYNTPGTLSMLAQMTDDVELMDDYWDNSKWQEVIDTAKSVNYYGDWFFANYSAHSSSINTAWYYIELFEKEWP